MSEVLPEPTPNTTWRDRALTGLSTAVVVGEINPITNDLVRVAMAGAIGYGTRDPVVTAAAMTGATALYEGVGSVGAAWLLGSDRAENTRISEVLKKVNTKINSILGREQDERLRPIGFLGSSAIAMVAGPPALLAIKQTIDPERTIKQNIRYGLVSSGLVSAVVGAETYLVADGIVDMDPKTGGAALAGAALIWYGAKRARERLVNRKGQHNYQKEDTT